MKFLRLIFFLFVGFCVAYAVKGGTLSASNISVTYTHSGGTFTVVNASALSSGVSTDDVLGQAYLNQISGPGGSIVGGDLWLLSATAAGANPDTVSDVNISVSAGTWYRLTARTLTRTTPGINAWHQSGINVYEFQGGTADTEKRVRIAGTNTSARPIRLVLRSGESTVIGTIDVPAGASYDQTFTVTDAQEAAGLHIDTFAQDQFKDGVWIAQDTFDPSKATKVGTTTTAAVTLPPGGIPDAPASSYSNRGPTSGPRDASTSGSSPWLYSNSSTSTADADRLDKATYREGIDKLEDAINGKPSDVPAAPTTEGVPAFTAPEDPNRLIDKLPAAPTVTGPTAPVTAITVALEIPGIAVAPVIIDFNRPGFSGPVSVFRGILLGVMTLIYLILSIRTVRGAFAGK